MEKLTCGCGNVLDEGDVFMNRGIARCSSCGVTNEIVDEPWFISRRNQIKQNSPVSPKISINRSPDKMEISFRWFHFLALFQLFFASLFSIGIFLGAFEAFKSGDIAGMLFASLFLTAIVAILFFQLRFCLNSTTITVTKETMIVKSGPLPVRKGYLSIPVEDIKNIYSARYSAGRGGQITSLEIVKNDGEKEILVNSLYSIEEARTIESAIRDFLAIPDKFEINEYLEPAPLKFLIY